MCKFSFFFLLLFCLSAKPVSPPPPHPPLPKCSTNCNYLKWKWLAKLSNPNIFSSLITLAVRGCLFPFVSGHRSLKIPKDWLFHPPENLDLIKIKFWWSRVPLLLWRHGQACYYFPTKFKLTVNTKDKHVEMCIWTKGAPFFGWSKWPYEVDGQSPLCLVGAIAEPKVNLWSETTVRQLFQDWLSVTWTSTFSVFVHNHGFCFVQSLRPTVFAVSGHRVLSKFGLQDTLSKKMCNTTMSLFYDIRHLLEILFGTF